jgi:hypothetical protein
VTIQLQTPSRLAVRGPREAHVRAGGRDAEVHRALDLLEKIVDHGGIDVVRSGTLEPRPHPRDRRPIHGSG